VFACSKNNVGVLRSLETASADPSLSASIHFADARGQSGAQQAQLWQCAVALSKLLTVHLCAFQYNLVPVKWQ